MKSWTAHPDEKEKNNVFKLIDCAEIVPQTKVELCFAQWPFSFLV